MLNFLPARIIGGLASIAIFLNTLFWCLLLYVAAIFKLIVPLRGWRKQWTKIAIWLAEAWISGNSAWMWLTQRTKWQVTGLEGLSYDDWYLVISNHQSWVDIFVLQHVFNKKIPFLKFFLKQELIWVPVIGLAWWALDFPFMKRYSKEQIARNPELRGKDLETTRKACERFKTTPVSVMNFLEGTRITPAKHQKQESPYRHLLKPKAGGIGFVLGAMGDQIDTMLDVTIVYPQGIPDAWAFLRGELKEVEVIIQERPIPAEYRNQDYQNDDAFREGFQSWVRDLWWEKDHLLSERLGLPEPQN
ncbi:MAG: acyltransferase [Ardenticatenaceae bacterium]|nr:acyltransferase [Ardenticatenaceae bacterium]MCB8946399.1 acyltransferase [Ardenticatenaceae bacterium]